MIRRIERDDGPRFQVYAQRDGRKVYVGTYETKRAAAEAEEDHRSTQRAIERGELPPELDVRRTLDAAVTDWLDALDQRGSRSHAGYSWFMSKMIRPTLGSVIAAKLTKSQIMAWRDAQATKYAPTTVNSALGCLASALSYFVDRGWIAASPAVGVKAVPAPARAYNWIRTVPELERLLRSCDDDTRDLIAVAVGTGMRIGELLSLAWDDVDLAGRLICVQRGLSGPTKSGRVRHVPILDSVLPVLQARALRRAGAFLVFPGRTGKTRHKSHVTVTYKAAVVRAGLDPSLRFHDLRHTMASWWVAGGGDIFRLSKVLGHSSVVITERTYAHLCPTRWAEDHHRVAFRVPTEPAKLYTFPRDEHGKLLGKRPVPAAAAVETRATREAG